MVHSEAIASLEDVACHVGLHGDVALLPSTSPGTIRYGLR